MKTPVLFTLALLLAGMPSVARDGGGGGGGSRGGGGSWGGGGDRGSGGGGGSWGGGSSRDGGGARSSAGASAGGRASAAPSSRGMSFARDSGVTRGIASRQGSERVPNHYYYHNEGGTRYWHYFDRGGLHWYGFYMGPSFYWFPFFSGYWWWYDANLARYDYWYNGYWWWNGPSGVPYVYADDNYVPYDQYQQQDQADSSEKMPEPPSAPPTAPPSAAVANAPAKDGSVVKSPNGKRMVQIEGSDGGATLFDESSTPPTFMKYLGKNAEKARFSGGSILVDFKDGSFALFDQDGNPPSKTAAPSAPPSAKTPVKEDRVVKSPDGKRTVRIASSDGGASLFDESTTPPTFMKSLGGNVEKVRFSGGSILVDFKDGTFGLFDRDGNPSGKPAAETAPGH